MSNRNDSASEENTPDVYAVTHELIQLANVTALTNVDWTVGTEHWDLTFKPEHEIQTLTLESTNAALAFLYGFKMGYSRFRPAATV